MSDSKTVTPVISSAVATQNNAATYVNNIPEEMESLDVELNEGFRLQSQHSNESTFRIEYLNNAVVAANKAVCRGNIGLYDRTIDSMAKLGMYRKSHTRDQVEQIFLETRDGKMLAEIVKCSREYLEAHK